MNCTIYLILVCLIVNLTILYNNLQQMNTKKSSIVLNFTNFIRQKQDFFCFYSNPLKIVL